MKSLTHYVLTIFQGCGYPPSVDCHNFLKIYGANGTNFTCFVARTNPELVIVNLDLHEVKSHLFYSLAVPFPCLFISLCYLVIAYKYIYNDKPEQNDVSAFSKPLNHVQYDVLCSNFTIFLWREIQKITG